MNSISIFGCGWLGLPLAEAFIAKGYAVKGSTTTPDKLEMFRQKGIEPFLLDFRDENLPDDFLKSDVWIFAFPPRSKRTDGQWYWQAIDRLSNLASDYYAKKVLHLSSTSVYPDLPPPNATSSYSPPQEGDENLMMTEDAKLTLENSGSPSLLIAEQFVLSIPNSHTYVLRLGGLAGYDRLLARHFAGKNDLKGGNNPVNLLHRDDAVGSILHLIENNSAPGIYNICSPEHPTRQELYFHDCLRFGMSLPHFADDHEKGKVISSEIIQEYYQFKFQNPMEFDYVL